MVAESDPSLRIIIAAEIPRENGGFAYDTVEITGDATETREIVDFYMSAIIALNAHPNLKPKDKSPNINSDQSETTPPQHTGTIYH